MIIIYECLDCRHCLSFGDGMRLMCNHPLLPADSMEQFEPLGGIDAALCEGFDDSETPGDLPAEEWDAACAAIPDDAGNNVYPFMREWLRAHGHAIAEDTGA